MAVVHKIMKEVHVPISRTYEYMALHGKGHSADVIKDLAVGRWSWISGWAQRNHKGP